MADKHDKIFDDVTDDQVEAGERALATALDGADADEIAVVRSVPRIAARLPSCDVTNRLEQQLQTNGKGMVGAMAKGRVDSHAQMILTAEHGNRPLKSPEERAWEDFKDRLEAARERSRAFIEGLPGAVAVIRAEYKILKTKLPPLVKQQHALVDKAEKLAVALVEVCKEAVAKENEGRKVATSVNHLVTPDRFIRTAGWCAPNTEGGVPAMVQHVCREIEKERGRLGVLSLHREGKKSESENLQDDRTARAAYQIELEKAAKAFRGTTTGRAAWEIYRKAMIAFNKDVSSGAELPVVGESHRMVGLALKVWYNRVCKHGNLEVRESFFPEIE